MVAHSHDATIAVCRALAEDFGVVGTSLTHVYPEVISTQSGFFWGVTFPLCCGARCILLDPVNTRSNPLAWLRTISDYQATVSAAPGSLFSGAARQQAGVPKTEPFSLAAWRVAALEAGGVRQQTVDRFNDTFARLGLRPTTLRFAMHATQLAGPLAAPIHNDRADLA